MATRFQLGSISTQAAPAGVVQAFAGSVAPTGWLLCDGTNYSRTTYAALFAIIGTTYDTQFNEVTGGNFTAPAGTDFRVPDYRASFLRGVGTASGKDGTTLGGRQGEKTKTPGTSFTTASQPLASGVAAAQVFTGNAHAHTGTTDATATQATPAGVLAGTGGSYGQTQSGNHTHTFTTTFVASTGTNAASSVTGTCPASTVNGGGDNETRPMNKGVNYSIKV